MGAASLLAPLVVQSHAVPLVVSLAGAPLMAMGLTALVARSLGAKRRWAGMSMFKRQVHSSGLSSSHASQVTAQSSGGAGSPVHVDDVRATYSANRKAMDYMHDPHVYKGTATTIAERERLGLTGLLPPRVLNQELQLARCLESLRHYERPLDQYVFLMNLLSRNERLFFRLVQEHLRETLPIIYTPTVGEACQKHAHILRNPRGLYLSYKDRGALKDVVANWPTRDVQAIVMTDGQRILGLGDLGCSGMGIPIGKLLLYTACGGVDPRQTLPVQLDVGTNNEELRSDELYLGLVQPRVTGAEYDAFVQEAIDAFRYHFGPDVLIQFEDFGNTNAMRLLEIHRNQCCTFNDDFQGTASVALAGVFGALRVPKVPKSLIDHRFLFMGAGTAGIGIADLIVAEFVKEGYSVEQAKRCISFIDSKGLVQAEREDLSDMKKKYTQPAGTLVLKAGENALLAAVEKLRPTCLVGVSTISGAFSPAVLRKMAELNERPIIMALSNPTSKAECTAEAAYLHTQGRAVFSSGSPFEPVEYKGRVFVPGQANNAMIFPGVALGILLSRAKHVPDSMFLEAARTLGELVPQANIDQGCMYPDLETIRACSAHIALAVAQQAARENLAQSPFPQSAVEIQAAMWDPSY
ncbi:NADP-dependent malic enzyme, chloroplastic [Porphyridium purpureum]|uniref:Malic enzyme n=1 Tax=Porphyridium purpureum TaxID=35688 RepID=A0A5J4YNT4_PORPP|nr:NADP-dependent malic enzyme, chloroplastic [Porphyridium purpureum]|eukprot:POR0986..scf222_8